MLSLWGLCLDFWKGGVFIILWVEEGLSYLCFFWTCSGAVMTLCCVTWPKWPDIRTSYTNRTHDIEVLFNFWGATFHFICKVAIRKSKNIILTVVSKWCSYGFIVVPLSPKSLSRILLEMSLRCSFIGISVFVHL